jgi:hypothetical protein
LRAEPLRTELACVELPRVPAVDLVFPFFDCSAARARVVEDERKFRVDGCCTEPFRPELVRVCRCLTALARLAEDDLLVRCCCFAALERAALARLAEDDLLFLVCRCWAELELARVAEDDLLVLACCCLAALARVAEDDRAWLAWERPVCLEAVCRAADFCGAALEDFEDLDCPTATP